jgi:hypothetical protein
MTFDPKVPNKMEEWALTYGSIFGKQEIIRLSKITKL